MSMERRSSLVVNPYQIRPEEILGFDDEFSPGLISPSSADGLSPKKEWSVLKYGSKLIPKSFKKFGESLRSLSQSDDEALGQKPRVDSSDGESGTEEERKKKKVLRVGFVSQSHDEMEAAKNRKMKMPQRAKSHPPPNNSPEEATTSRSDKSKPGCSTGSTQIPEIMITRVHTSSETICGGGDNSPPPRRPTKFLPSDNPSKCKRCLKFVENLKRIYKGVRVRREKYQILTSVPPRIIDEGDILAKEFGCSEALAYSALALRATQGAFSCPQPQFVQHIPEYIKTTIMDFFLEVENSGNMKSRDDPFYYGELFGGVKRKAMFISLSELYQEYLYLHSEHRKSMNISRFAYFIPRNVVWSKPFRGNSYNSCMVHENLQLMLQACTTYYSEGISKVLSIIVCSQNNTHCMLGFCETCPMPGSMNLLTFDCDWDEDLEYHIWMKDLESDDELEAACAPMKLAHVMEPAPAFIGRLNRLVLGGFLKHQFIYMMQKEYLQHLNSYLCMKPSVAFVKMDFCEPYQALSKIGPMKSNLVDFDPRNNISVHPFCIRYFEEDKGKVETRYVVVISNLLREDATSSYIFRAEMVKWMRHALPQIKKIVYFSDDNPKHFRNSETILNLLYHEEDFKLKADHEFTVEGHENQECETLVTQIKRRSRLASLSGDVEISNAEEMFQFCRAELARYDLQFSFVNGLAGRIKNLEGKLGLRYRVNDGVLPGINVFYSFRPEFGKSGSMDIVHMRRYSLSKHEKQLRVRLSTANCAGVHDIYGHEVTQYLPEMERRGTVTVLNPEKLFHGNLVNLNLEGAVYRGRIENHDRVALGELKVSLVGKMEKKLRKKKRGEKESFVNWKTERTVWISTLDVISVAEVVCEEEYGDLKGYLRRFSTVSVGKKEKGEAIRDTKRLQRRSSSCSPSRILASLSASGKKH